VQYPHETLKMPDALPRPHQARARSGDRPLALHGVQPLRARLPQRVHRVEGIKREGEKKKSVSEYVLDFTTCSLCGSCIEACPSDAIEFSKDYNVVSLDREDFSHMDLVRQLAGEREAWAQHPGQPAAPVAQPAPTAPVPVP
jgi:NADH-quinone oxidoreductase subunit I